MNGCSYYCCGDYCVSHFQVVFIVVIIIVSLLFQQLQLSKANEYKNVLARLTCKGNNL